MEDFEKLGSFYLGRVYDLAAGALKDDLLLYDAKDLVTHAVCVGMTGSGKTGLCIGLLEEAALDGVPAIVIDPKGDLCDLMLTFPELRPADFRPWVNEDDAARTGVSPDDYAAQQADVVAEGAGRLGPGRRAHRAPAGRRRRRDLHPGQHGGVAGLDPGLLRGAGGRGPRRRRAPARPRGHDGDQPARPARHRGRPHPQPGVHPADYHRRPGVAGWIGAGPGSVGPAGTAAAGRAGGRSGPGVVLPGQGAVRAGDGAQQPACLAGVRGVDGGRGPGRRPPVGDSGG